MNLEHRLEKIEAKVAFIDDAIESQNIEITKMSADLSMAKEALQHIYKKLTNLMENAERGMNQSQDDAPPPHY